jgi:SHS2 domain-containing protein
MHEIFEHTADVGIRAKAASLPELFADAARGLFSVIVANLEAVRTSDEVAFQLADDGVEDLLHDWLTELLYTFHVRRMVLKEFDVTIGAGGLSATARGEPIDLGRHEIDVEVKAITWHGFKLEQTPDGWLAEVIVDI